MARELAEERYLCFAVGVAVYFETLEYLVHAFEHVGPEPIDGAIVENLVEDVHHIVMIRFDELGVILRAWSAKMRMPWTRTYL